MIEEIFTEADSNRADGNINGKIELREFLCWCASSCLRDPPHIRLHNACLRASRGYAGIYI